MARRKVWQDALDRGRAVFNLHEIRSEGPTSDAKRLEKRGTWICPMHRIKYAASSRVV